jgi:hypothetical protein
MGALSSSHDSALRTLSMTMTKQQKVKEYQFKGHPFFAFHCSLLLMVGSQIIIYRSKKPDHCPGFSLLA